MAAADQETDAMSRPLPRPESDALVHDPDGALERLREIMRRLRAPDGCPWDREQDFRSIAPYTIEEAYEVADAIEREAMRELRDELGDLLLQVVYHAQMAEEAGLFDFDDVARGCAEKMLRRHPHVFGDETGDKSADQQVVDWERIKAAERAARGEARVSALDGLAAGLPGMTRAVKLQNRAARVGFDWPDAGSVIDKVAEEARELVEAREARDADATEAEFGDLLFVVANLARHLKVDPETAVRRTNAKFERRFREVERRLAAQGRAPGEAGLAEMDALWEAIKAEERGAGAL
jgi:ATP diphosphatase